MYLTSFCARSTNSEEAKRALASFSVIVLVETNKLAQLPLSRTKTRSIDKTISAKAWRSELSEGVKH